MKKLLSLLCAMLPLLSIEAVTTGSIVSSITSGNYYRLTNVAYGTDYSMTENGGLITTSAKSDTNYFQLWKITKSGSGYTLQNVVSENYIQTSPGKSTQFYTGSTAKTFYTHKQGSGTSTSFALNASSTSDTYTALHCANTRNYNVVGWTYSGANASYWYLEEVSLSSDDWTAIENVRNQVQLKDGQMYRFVSYYPTLSLNAAGDGVASTTTNASAFTQVWQIECNGGNASRIALKNAVTGQYIQNSPGRSMQYKMGSSVSYFIPHIKESSGTYSISFQSATTNTDHGLHTAATQNYNVVGWNWSVDASYWTLEHVTLTAAQQEELANAQQIFGNDYTSQLSTFFTDAACTTLRNNYASMTDANLRTQMANAGLPTALQDMAISVKNNTWNSEKDATWNSYEKDFRIHAYDIYSNSDMWRQCTGIGPFAHLFHPTGIQTQVGDIIHLYVNNTPKDNKATLQAELVSGTDRKGAAYTLKQGYNAIYAPIEGEVFVSYLLNDTTLSCNDYPDITVHIEGGTMNGCFDMRGHGHDNADWAWLKTNMFQGKYLHVKGNSTMLNVLKNEVVGEENAVGVMNLWDFCFDKLQSLAGCDRWKQSGRYKMMINNFRNEAGGNPHWSAGNYGTSHPRLNSDYLFNYSGLANIWKNGGALWEITHEEGHGHQTPINLSGMTESSNNSLAQAVNLLAKDNIGENMFQSVRTSRGDGISALVDRYNQEGSYSWIDIGGMRTQSGPYSDVWISNKMYFQLWLYFDYLGHYQPAGGNTGFSFISTLYDWLRQYGITKSTNSASPALATQDYLLIAKYAADITQTDLSEFFEAWGFWKLSPSVSNSNDIPSASTWIFGDYSNTYIQTSADQVAAVKQGMQQYTQKAPNLMFLEDRGVGCTLASSNGAESSTFGLGYYPNFDQTVQGQYTASVEDNTVTITGGTGAVGFKIYDSDGNIAAIGNTTTFTVTDDVAQGLASGTYSIVAAQGFGTNVETQVAPTRLVTFKLYLDDQLVDTQADIPCAVGATPQLPSNMKKMEKYGNWVTYTYTPSTITDETTEVAVKATWCGPFLYSTDYTVANWYYLKMKPGFYGQGYITYQSSSTPNVAIPTSNAQTDATKWAFIGSPYSDTGFTLVNKAAGNGYVLGSASPNGDGNTGANTYATLATAGTQSYEIWNPTPSSHATGGFFLYSNNGYALNLRSNSNLAYWTDNADAGSTFVVEAAFDNFASNVMEEVGMFFADDAVLDTYFTISSAQQTEWKAEYTKYSTTATATQYQAFVNKVKSAIRYPRSGGKFRIKSSGTRTDTGQTYIGYGTSARYQSTGLVTVLASTKDTDKTTILQLTGEGGTYKISIPSLGWNVQSQTEVNKAFPVTAATGVDFTFAIVSPGWVSISNSGSSVNSTRQGALHEAGDGDSPRPVVNWTTGAAASHWTIEDAFAIGDLNEDGAITLADITALVNIVLHNTTAYDSYMADVNGDGNVDMADVNAIIANILHKEE